MLMILFIKKLEINIVLSESGKFIKEIIFLKTCKKMARMHACACVHEMK